jgi:DNA-binding transcriptional LysR family regulator
MSNALARMRLFFGDPLLVRTRSGMRLTPRGEDLRDNLIELCAKLDGLSRQIAFDPQGPETTFRIVATDAASMILAPSIVHHVRKSGPSIVMSVHSQQCRKWGKEDADDYDIYVGYGETGTGDRTRLEIFRDELVIICRPGTFEEGRLLVPADIEALHIIAPSADGSYYSHIVDQWLEGEGLTGQIVIRTSGLSNIPAIVSQTDLIALLPATLAKALLPDFPVQILRYSRSLPNLVFQAEWPAPSDSNVAHTWLVEMLVDAAARLARSSHSEANIGCG